MKLEELEAVCSELIYRNLIDVAAFAKLSDQDFSDITNKINYQMELDKQSLGDS